MRKKYAYLKYNKNVMEYTLSVDCNNYFSLRFTTSLTVIQYVAELSFYAYFDID